MKIWAFFLFLSFELLFARVPHTVPGSVLTIPYTFSNPVPTLFGHRAAACHRHGKKVWLLAVPLWVKPGRYSVTVPPKHLVVSVVPKAYKIQRIVLKNDRRVSPPRSVYVRLKREARRKKRAKAFRSASVADADFIWPVKGVVSSAFGLRRFFNGKPRAPHRGLDIAASEGMPVRAASAGRVVEAGDFFFSGNLVFIEHGQGLTSLYAHMSRIVVRPGDKVAKGQVIGYVGHTGRATGPHLHFGVLIDGAYVDPAALLPNKRVRRQPSAPKRNPRNELPKPS
ncbi:M23 family metallopeptidase [Hydrogenimonas sp. SS33]|uniref:M23 family metallopeptidase n=1 Tax=Hydrogenimonas leucolamina TaxID=2954236 RepID=UPI00336C21FB